MDNRLGLLLTIGFVIFCVGVAVRSYMTIRVNGGILFRVPPEGSTELGYIKLIKERHAPVWPLIVSTACTIVGIVVIFGALFWTGMHRGH